MTKINKTWFDQGEGFLCLPIQAIRDRRLGLPELRVLMALASHANRDGQCYPSRARIKELTGLHEVSISQATTKLLGAGWLKDRERGNVGKSTRYTLTIPPDQVLDTGPRMSESQATKLKHRRDDITKQLEDTFTDPKELAEFRAVASAAAKELRKAKPKPRPALGSKPRKAAAKTFSRSRQDDDE